MDSVVFRKNRQFPLYVLLFIVLGMDFVETFQADSCILHGLDESDKLSNGS